MYVSFSVLWISEIIISYILNVPRIQPNSCDSVCILFIFSSEGNVAHPKLMAIGMNSKTPFLLCLSTVRRSLWCLELQGAGGGKGVGNWDYPW